VRGEVEGLLIDDERCIILQSTAHEAVTDFSTLRKPRT